MEDPVTGRAVIVLHRNREYLVNEEDRDVLETLLSQVTGGFAAVMFCLTQGRARAPYEVLGHLNLDGRDFRRLNIFPTTRRERCYPSLDTRPRAPDSHWPQQIVTRDGAFWRVLFRTPPPLKEHIDLGRYNTTPAAWAIYRAYQKGMLDLCLQHAVERRQGLPLSRGRRRTMLAQLGISDPPPRQQGCSMHLNADHTGK